MKVKLWDKGYVKTIEDKLGCKYYNINTSRENRVNAVTSIAAISRGKDNSNNPEKRYSRLLKEAAPDISYYDLLELEESKLDISKTAGRPLEYAPVVLTGKIKTNKVDFTEVVVVEIELKDKKAIELDYSEFVNGLGKFSYIVEEFDGLISIYTNVRALINAGIDEGDIPFNRFTELLNYFIIEVKVPYFVFAQLRTHGLLSQVAVSGRVVDEDEIWLPNDILERLDNAFHDKERRLAFMDKFKDCCDKEDLDVIIISSITVNDLDSLVEVFKLCPIDTVREILKFLGYKKEIYDRWYNFMEYKTFIIGGWLNNPYQWGHFLLEREAFDSIFKSWVQPQTKETAKAIRELLDNYIKNTELKFDYSVVEIENKKVAMFSGLEENNE